MAGNERSDDPRMGTLIKALSTNRSGLPKISLIGFPYDEGIVRNGGRAGAKHGPEAVWKFIAKTGAVHNAELDLDLRKYIEIEDRGFVNEGDPCELEVAHEKLRRKVYNALKDETLPIVIGGGNDQSYINFSSFSNYLREKHSKRQMVSVINIDAHLDVRPLIDGKAHSGSPFRQLLDSEDFCGDFTEFASQSSQCSKKHSDYVLDKGGKIFWYNQICNDPVKHFKEILDTHSDRPMFLSFDIDSIRGADAPGVSCPGSIGLTSDEALKICRLAGHSKRLKIVDFSETNPIIENYQTPKLVANMIYEILIGKAILLSRKK